MGPLTKASLIPAAKTFEKLSKRMTVPVPCPSSASSLKYDGGLAAAVP